MSKFALTVENLTKIYSNPKTKTQNTALNNLNFKGIVFIVQCLIKVYMFGI